MHPSTEVVWYLQSRCNYDCAYCSFTLGQGRERLLRIEKTFPLHSWTAAWQRFFDQHGEASIYITGSGEPTLYPRFIELLRSLADRHQISFDTNLSWPISALRRFIAEIDPRRIRVETSFHHPQAEIGHFTDKARLLRDHGFAITCRLVAYPHMLDQIDRFRGYFADKGLHLALTPFQGSYRGAYYPQAYNAKEMAAILGAARFDEVELLRRNYPQLISHLLSQHREVPGGRRCSAGHRHACLMPDGLVYRCLEHWLQGHQPLGDFFDGAFRLTPEPAACFSPVCGVGYRWIVDEAERFGIKA